MTNSLPDDLSPLIAGWPAEHTLAVADDQAILGAAGDLDAVRRIASITKLFTSYAALIAWEEGTLTLDDAAGPDGSTVRHLMAHASGLGFSEGPQAAAGTRRIYSNTGIEALAEHLATQAGMPFADYLQFGVLEPLGLGHVTLTGSPAHGLFMSVRDLITFGHELLSPTLVHVDTLAVATAPVFGELAGVLPGFGSQDPNPWGLGFEIRGNKSPHWTGPNQSPRTFGHFGGAGSFLWVDPDRRLIGASTGTKMFDEWAADVWPPANAALIERYGS